eukprot:gene1861-6297_t
MAGSLRLRRSLRTGARPGRGGPRPPRGKAGAGPPRAATREPPLPASEEGGPAAAAAAGGPGVIAATEGFVLGTYTRPGVVFTRGEGCELFDAEGTAYLDFVAGIAVNCLGHSDPGWVAAVQAQAAALCHVSNLYYTAPQAELAETLVESA